MGIESILPVFSVLSFDFLESVIKKSRDYDPSFYLEGQHFNSDTVWNDLSLYSSLGDARFLFMLVDEGTDVGVAIDYKEKISKIYRGMPLLRKLIFKVSGR